MNEVSLPPSLSPSFQFSFPPFLSLLFPLLSSFAHLVSIYHLAVSMLVTGHTKANVSTPLSKVHNCLLMVLGYFELHRLFFLTREKRSINTFIYLGNKQGWFAFMKPGFGTRNATSAQSWICLLFKLATRIKLESSLWEHLLATCTLCTLDAVWL